MLFTFTGASGADICAKPTNGCVELRVAAHKGRGQGAELCAVQADFSALGMFSQAVLSALLAGLGALCTGFNASLVDGMIIHCAHKIRFLFTLVVKASAE